MAKILVERPPRGMRMRLKRRKLHQGVCRRPEDTLRYEPMSRGRGTRFLNENLSPLVRYLGAQVGRPWSKVYSEISACLQPSNAVQQHVRDHLWDFVAVKAWEADGEIVVPWRWGQPTLLSDTGGGSAFYVSKRKLRRLDALPATLARGRH